jgi:hypothetical protein
MGDQTKKAAGSARRPETLLQNSYFTTVTCYFTMALSSPFL